MHAVAVGRFHHDEIRGFTFLRTGMHDLSRRNFVVAHAANVSGEEQAPRLAVRVQRDFRHARSQNVCGADEAE